MWTGIGITSDQLCEEIDERLEADKNGKDKDRYQIYPETDGYTLDELVKIGSNIVGFNLYYFNTH